MKRHENYRELIWVLAKTDFKLRYHGSVLGYVWAILKPLLLFLILNFVFSSIFNPRNTAGSEYFSLQLLTAIMLFNFFSEGTSAGLSSLLGKSSLVTKIYVPRWAIIFASTIQSALIFLMNLIVIAVFFVYYQFIPSWQGLLVFFLFIFLTYLLILIFSFAAAPLYLKFRDIQQIWDVAITAMFYAAPIVYPLSILPANLHKIILLNPIAFIVHYGKFALINNQILPLWQMGLFIVSLIVFSGISFLIYTKLKKRIAENI